MTNNFNELKRAFDAECKIAEQLVKGKSSHPSEYAAACVIVRLLHGRSVRSIHNILDDGYRVISALRADAILDTDKVY